MAQYVTLSALRERARQEADVQNSSHVSDSEANRYINDAIAELVDLLISKEDHPWESKRVALYVPAGYQAIWLPCDFYNLISVSYIPGSIYNSSVEFALSQDSGSNTISGSITGSFRDKTPMVPFMEFEKETLKGEEWTAENPPKYRLTCLQPRPEVIALIGTIAEARGYTYISDFSETFPSTPDSTSFSYWHNSCDLSALPSGADPSTEEGYVAKYVPPVVYYSSFGFVLEFDRASSSEELLKIHYHPRASELSADTDVFIDYNGWAAYVVVSAAIKMRSKEESDTTELRYRKAEAIDRITNVKRDHGQPQRVVDRTQVVASRLFRRDPV